MTRGSGRVIEVATTSPLGIEDADAEEGAAAGDIARNHGRAAGRPGELAADLAAREAAADIAGDEVRRLERPPHILLEGDRPVDVLADRVVDRLAALEPVCATTNHQMPATSSRQKPQIKPMNRREAPERR